MFATIWTCTQEWSDMPEPLGERLLHVPPAAQALVGVGGREQRLELAVAAGRDADVELGDVHGAPG